MVYSATGLPLIRCSATTRAAFSGVILTYVTFSLPGSNTSTTGSYWQMPMQPVCAIVTLETPRDLVRKSGKHRPRAGGDTAGGHADHDARVAAVVGTDAHIAFHLIPESLKLRQAFHK